MSVEFDRESPGKFDSRTLSRETLSRWTGRMVLKSHVQPKMLTMAVLEDTDDIYM